MSHSVQTSQDAPISIIYGKFWEVLDWIYPPDCIVCHKCGYRICPECLSNFRQIQTGCEICGITLAKPGICKHCQDKRPTYDHLRSLFEYKDVVREAIHQVKFHNDLGLAEKLAEIMSQYLLRLNWQLDLIVPMPLNERRQYQRGYNQSALLALPIALKTRTKYAPYAIERIKDTKSQVGLSASERWENVADAFSVNSRTIQGKNLLIVDDVVTTGATMNAIAAAVKKGGAKKIFCLSFARAIKYNLDMN